MTDMTEATEPNAKIFLQGFFYAHLRFIGAIVASVASCIEESILPFFYFLGIVLFLEWLLFDKLGYRETSRVHFDMLNENMANCKRALDRYVSEMVKIRRIVAPLTLISVGLFYLFSKKHEVEFIVPILFYMGFILVSWVYLYLTKGMYMAYPINSDVNGSGRSVDKFGSTDYMYYNPSSPNYVGRNDTHGHS